MPPAPVVLQTKAAGEVEALAGKQAQPVAATAAEGAEKVRLRVSPVPPLPAVPLVAMVVCVSAAVVSVKVPLSEPVTAGLIEAVHPAQTTPPSEAVAPGLMVPP